MDAPTANERCYQCKKATGRSGLDYDSLYAMDGRGPFCERCWPYSPDPPRDADEKPGRTSDEATPDRLEAMILKTLMERYRRYGYPGDYASIDDRDRAVARAAVEMCEGEAAKRSAYCDDTSNSYSHDHQFARHWSLRRMEADVILAALRAIRGERK